MGVTVAMAVARETGDGRRQHRQHPRPVDETPLGGGPSRPVALAIGATDWGETATRVHVVTVDMAQTLFEDFVLPFEIVSVLLLAAVIGGVYLAKREPGGPS